MKHRIMPIISTILSISLLIGIKTIFKTCGMKDDGTWMLCHWTEQTILIEAIIMSAISITSIITNKSKISIGLSISMIVTSILTLLTPGTLMPLCKMPMMECHIITQPSTIIIASLIIIMNAINIIMMIHDIKRKKTNE